MTGHKYTVHLNRSAGHMIPFYGKVFNKAIETERNNTQPAIDRFA